LEAGNAGGLFIFLGIVFGLLGLCLFGIVETQTYSILGYTYNITYNPHIFTGSILIGVGVSWFIVGIIFAFAGREVAGDGLLAAFFLGALGAILWLLFSHEQGTCVPTFRTYPEEPHVHCSSCNRAVPMQSTQFCPYCGQKLKQAEPSEDRTGT